MMAQNADDFVMEHPMTDSGVYRALIERMAHPTENAHLYEESIRSRLVNDACFGFENLIVRRMPHGFCLEGEVACSREDFSRLTEEVYALTGAEVIINRMTHREVVPHRKG